MLSMELKKVIPWAKRPYDLIDLIHNNTTTLPVGEKILQMWLFKQQKVLNLKNIRFICWDQCKSRYCVCSINI